MVGKAGDLFAPDELEPMPAFADFMERKEFEPQLDECLEVVCRPRHRDCRHEAEPRHLGMRQFHDGEDARAR